MINQFTLPKRSLITYLNALWRIARKDWTIYWRYPVNAISTVFEPILWLTPIYFLGKTFSINGEAIGFAGYSGITDYMSFIILGEMLSSFVSAVFWGMGYSLKNDMDSGVMESNWMTPIPRLFLLAGRTLNSMLITTITSTATIITAGLVFGFEISSRLGAALLTLIPVLIGLYGFGFAFAALVMIVREANTMVDLGNTLVNFFSGTQFPIQALPRWLMPISFAIPLTYGFDAIRGLLINTNTVLPIQTEILLLLVFMVVMVIIGTTAFRALERKVRRLGTLGQH